MMRARTALLGIGGAIALTIGGSTAYAAIAGGPVDASGVVHGCYTNAEVNGSHALVLQDAGTTCPKGTTAVSWNEQGSAGATGPQGPAGPTGTQGPAGPAGAAGATGATGEQGPAGPAGASSLDALIGTPCDVMGANPGTLQVTYTSVGNGTDSVDIQCAQNNPQFAVTVNAVSEEELGASGYYYTTTTITSSDGKFNVAANGGETQSQTVVYSDNAVVTLTTNAQWVNCPAADVNADYTVCTLTVNGVYNLTAN